MDNRRNKEKTRTITTKSKTMKTTIYILAITALLSCSKEETETCPCETVYGHSYDFNNNIISTDPVDLKLCDLEKDSNFVERHIQFDDQGRKITTFLSWSGLKQMSFEQGCSDSAN
jgi:hypothetical protein